VPSSGHVRVTCDPLSFLATPSTCCTLVGNPVDSGTRYELCVYDGSGNSQPLRTAVVAGRGTCAGQAMLEGDWQDGDRATSTTTSFGTPDGVTQLQVKTGSAGKSQLRVQGKGAQSLATQPDPDPSRDRPAAGRQRGGVEVLADDLHDPDQEH